ncbi:hypothetical protein DM02DRAFT_329485 [Periconia macrospinosa]|uniref:Uncharacterized protein n=1 Tax=Periconia macrospinosa TaxID=97972 RepID=A0A2V1DUE9_9PLEO|nr:hypothetical protein DM02DRAFT_329485 [Periconia macrospinosa]
MVVLVARQRLSWLQQPRKIIDEEEESVDGRCSTSSDERRSVEPRLDNNINANQNSTLDSIIVNGERHPKNAEKNANGRVWPRLFASKKRDAGSGGDWVPSVSGVIKAGDEGIYTSAIFYQLHQQNPSDELYLDALYELFANQLRNRPLLERTAYPSEISKFLASSKKVQRSKSMHVSREARRPTIAPPSKGTRSSLDLSEVTSSLTRSLSKKSSSASDSTITPIPAHSSTPKHALWTKDLQQIPSTSTLASLKLTSSELAALSLILGSPTSPASTHRKAFRKGAYGLTLSHTPLPDGTHHTVTLHAHPLSIPQRPAPHAAITSTLHAKHMACNCLPLSPSSPSPTTTSTPTLLLTPATLTALLTKSPLPPPPPSTSPSKSYLETLPHARTPTFPAYTLPDLLRSIAALPFASSSSSSSSAAAGLPPLAGATLIDTVLLVASGGKPPGKLAQRLEALVDKVSRFCGADGAADAYGPMYEARNVGLLFRERERLGRLEGVEEEEEELVGRTARVGRWVGMLARLVAMLDSSSPTSPVFFAGGGGEGKGREKVVGKVVEETFHDLLDAYTALCLVPSSSSSASSSSHSSPSPSTTTSSSSLTSTSQQQQQQQQRTPQQPQKTLPPSPPLTPTKLTLTSPPSSTTTKKPPRKPSSSTHQPDQPQQKQTTLAKDIESLLQSPLPFSTRQVARLARCVLVAWAVCGGVERVSWDDEPAGKGEEEEEEEGEGRRGVRLV